MREEGIVDNAKRIGAEVIGPRLAELAERHEIVGRCAAAACSGRFELVSERESR